MKLRPGRARSAAAGPPPGERDLGMVTAELAVALPALVVVIVAALTGIAALTAQLRCADAAAVAARLAARGEPAAVVRAAVMSAAPGGAQLSVHTSPVTTVATIRVRLDVPGLTRLLPGVAIHATAVAATEPTPIAAEPVDGG